MHRSVGSKELPVMSEGTGKKKHDKKKKEREKLKRERARGGKAMER